MVKVIFTFSQVNNDTKKSLVIAQTVTFNSSDYLMLIVKQLSSNSLQQQFDLRTIPRYFSFY